jgi:magnesium-transporting ATPase (P-type)
MALLLWVGGLIGFLAQMPQLGIAVWMVNLINGAFSFWQEYKAEQATAALWRMLPTYARVLREGVEQRLLAEELVPGDVIVLSEGDHISADGRLVEVTELRVDQSALTGESHPVRKTAEALLHSRPTPAEIPNLVFAGTSVVAGTGRAVVFATGMQSEFGKIAHLTQAVSDERSPLQKEMVHVTKMVTLIAVGVGLVFFVLAATLARVTLADSVIFALGMIVAFVPEGLLPTVTLALAMGTQRMARRHALIKRLSAVETLGCTTAICTDKTGTLTQNAMTVRELWVAGRWLTVTGVGYAPKGQILEDNSPLSQLVDADLRQLLVAAGLCNDARLLPPNTITPQWTALGDPTEVALRVVASKGGIDLDAEAEHTPRRRELPFDARRKRMSTIHTVRQGRRSTSLVYVKGAPTEVLAVCTRVLWHGQECSLETTQRAQILAANDAAARRGLRVLAVAQRVLPEGLSTWTPETVECELTFLGLLAMLDPPRPEVAEAVAKCHRAGIRIIMITGDYGLTAESIARPLGIICGSQLRLITGADLAAMGDQALQAALQGEVLFALSGRRIPLALSVMQILSIDLGADTIPALALGAEPPAPGMMARRPRSLREHLITKGLVLRAGVVLGPIQSLAAMSAFYYMYWTNGYWGQWLDLPAHDPLYHAATAMTLAAIGMTQIGNLFAQRTEQTSVFRIGLCSNSLVWVGIATELSILVLLRYTPFLQQLFGTAPLLLGHWVFLFAWTPILLLADEGYKALVRYKDRQNIHGSGRAPA